MLLSASVSKSQSMEKQGIVTILCSDCEKSKSSSLRRTLSADMSSKKWLQQNGFFTKTPSQPSDQSSHDSSSDGEEDCTKEKDNHGVATPSASDVWGSILSKKNEDSIKISTPYVHPLVKRSASCLSEKSLEICTESLGSETGSDTLSSYPSSEISDEEKGEKEDFAHQGQLVDKSNSFEGVRVVKYKNTPPRPLPPPILSISADGSSIRLQSHRQNGRLVLEAISVPQRNNFVVKRYNGRLVLSLLNSSISEKSYADAKVEEKIDHEKINYGGSDGGYQEEEVVVEAAEDRVKQNHVTKGVEFIIMDHNTRSFPIGGTMKKLMRLGNKNPNKIVNLKEVDHQEVPITQSLPPRPGRVPRLIPSSPPPAATATNSYHYFWRNKTAALITPQHAPLKNNACLNNGGIKTYANHQNMVVIKGNKDVYYVPSSRSCKKPRKSMLIWEPYCVAS